MVLAIDIGNTNIVIGCIDGEKILFVERLSTDPSKTELEYAISFKNVLEMYGIDGKEVEGVILSSVVPQLLGALMGAARKAVGREPKVVGPGMRTGLNILTDNPAQVGSDLIVGAVAGLKEYGAPLILIDMGTATTISVVDAGGNYVGGAILPGAGTSLDALVSRTAQLPRISMDAPRKVIGRNTVDCMKSGILYGSAACIDGMVERMEAELGGRAAVVATGGLAGAVIPYCRREIVLDDALLLKGLKILYDRNP